MKTTDHFKKTINEHLVEKAKADFLFAETLAKPNKNIDECINYILDTVKKSGCNGFDDSEIFAMAVHYYDEDDIKNIKPVSGKVIINHSVELTEEDKAEAKAEAMKQVIAEAKEEAKKSISGTIELSEEDLKEAKKQAIEKIAIDQKQKLVAKAVKNKTETKVEQVDLFA